MRVVSVLAFLLLGVAGPALAEPFDDGLAAYTRADYAAAASLLRPAAEAGEPRSQNLLGFLYEQGRGVAQSSATAVAWYRKAADQGFAAAQYNLGTIYERGHGVRRDPAAAIGWYQKAADQGLAAAAAHLRTLRAKTPDKAP